MKRQETAAAVTYLVDRLSRSQSPNFPRKLRVLDLCTGSGCIPLLFAHIFPYEELGVNELDTVGVDVSSEAISLARFNRRRLLQEYKGSAHHVCGISECARKTAVENIQFLKADVLEPSPGLRHGSSIKLCQTLTWKGSSSWDIVISNPPYISPKAFNITTSRSVRNFEPKLALVPSSRAPVGDEAQGDQFYPRLLELSEFVDANILLVEVSDMDQANRVASMARERKRWDGIEIWRDEPQLQQGGNTKEVLDDISVIGHGHGRSVLCWTMHGGQLMGKP
jgi:methylase of polypeptide subunit release factors